MANPTTNLGMTKPTVGGSTDTWGTTLNENVVDIIDALFSISGTDVTMSDIKFNSMSVQETGAGTDTVKIQAPSAVTTSYTLTMPAAVGTANQVLSAADGSGTLAWTTPDVGDITAIVAGAGLTGTSLSGPIPTLNVIGTADKITVSADAVTIASTYVGQTSITTLGTIATGTWEGTTVAVDQGGTGATTLTDGGVLLGSGTGAITATSVLGDGEILIGDASGDPATLDVGSSTAITILGTVATGVWNGTPIANANLASSSVGFGGVSVSLGGADGTPTFNLVNGTNYGAGNLAGATLAGGVTASSLTSLGTIGSLVATTADINGGTIDGTTIGASTPSTAAVTTAHISKNATASRTAVIRPVTVETTASGSAANPYAGFGTGIEFRMTDYAAYLEPAGAIDCVMDGSDNLTPPDSGFKSGIVFSTVPLQSSGITNKMWLTGAGNLGVGISLPVQKLSVLQDTESVKSALFAHAHASNPFGIEVKYTGGAPNGTADEFLICSDSSATRMTVRSNGGITNYQSNDVDLSDERLKVIHGPTASTWNAHAALEVFDYNYTGSPDTRVLIGVGAAQAGECDERLRATDEWETGGEKYHGLYTKDVSFYTMKTVQECQARIEELETRLVALGA